MRFKYSVILVLDMGLSEISNTFWTKFLLWENLFPFWGSHLFDFSFSMLNNTYNLYDNRENNSILLFFVLLLYNINNNYHTFFILHTHAFCSTAHLETEFACWPISIYCVVIKGLVKSFKKKHNMMGIWTRRFLTIYNFFFNQSSAFFLMN